MKIDNNIPISPVERRPPKGRAPSLATRTVRKLQPGQSVFIQAKTPRVQQKYRTLAYKELGKGNYAVRLREEDGKTGIRIWRTA
jgi:hypothetical protein